MMRREQNRSRAKARWAGGLLLGAWWMIAGCDSDTSDTRSDIAEAGRDTKEAITRTLDQWRRDLSDLDVKMAQWSRDVENRIDEMSEDARVRYEELRSDLAKQRDALAAEFESASTSAGEAWNDTKASVERAWENLKNSFERARNEIGKP